ncbi:hypothetical protein FSP39_012106 [Pinctada imbricata]|uniref:Uncharacterized protein n=1 Tax=Pinctada imbricata TaxID=66713 RepID=A0AA89BSQ2_PINIB|nr:hypothetical protein FSP39_012106 [Pinctada imbricata]
MMLRICVFVVMVYGIIDFTNSHPHDDENKCPGCEYEGDCVDRNKKWDDKEDCTKYHCKVIRRKDKDSGKLTFHVGLKRTSYGCPYNGTCEDFGKKWKEEDKCRQFRCLKKRHPHELRGLASISHNLKSKIFGCRYGGECKENKDQWNVTELCEEYTCIARRRKFKDGTTGFFSKLKINKYGCSFQGVCRSENEEWMDGCNRRKCLISARSSITDIIKSGCKDNNGTCHEENATWTENCITVQCQVVKVDKNTYQMTNKNIGFGCPYKGKCLKLEEEVVEDCITKKCSYNEKNKTRVVTPVDFECMDADGKCRKLDETGYPMMIKGKRYENCNCTLTTKPDGSYSIGKKCSGSASGSGTSGRTSGGKADGTAGGTAGGTADETTGGATM